MLKAFPIDFIRQIIEQTLFIEHENNHELVGGKAQVNLFSFYEQLATEEEVDRYVEIYRDLTNQENRSDLILNGTIVAPENPTYTNINQRLNIPMTFTCSFRATLKDRELGIYTINNLIEKLKGRKVDIAELDNGKLFMVGTVANNSIGAPAFKKGDFLGIIPNNPLTFDTNVGTKLSLIATELGISVPTKTIGTYYYFEYGGILRTTVVGNNGKFVEISDNSEYPNIPIPPQHTEFTKYQVSLSFDSTRVDEPRNLNSEQYCNISFGGSATISDYRLMLGNELTKVCISKSSVKGETTFTYASNANWLEPLEMPNSLSPNTKMKQLLSNGFLTNEHIDSIATTLQYTFLLDKSIDLLWELFIYARYGIYAIDDDYVSPNTIYKITEILSCWGEVYKFDYYAKLTNEINIENTESDTLTISLSFKQQGAND